MPFGAQVCAGGVRFRLWAPALEKVEVCLEDGGCLRMHPVDSGWFELTTDVAGAGTQYQFRVNGKTCVPDPASRFQPQDVHGPSEVIDADAFNWNDDEWRGRRWEEAVIYELHTGTFTPEGAFQGVESKLDYLRDLGVTAIELMPVADFPGTRNWGYDGVLPFAPDSCYGRPEDLKRLVQAAHAKGLMIFLDVVYNHFGPEGNYLRLYSPQFFTSRHCTPWGDGINFDGAESRTVRDFFIHNALYWLEEYRFDGLRLDAVHAIVDDSHPHILTELAEAVRERFDGKRIVHLVLENGENAARYMQRDSRGRARWYDAQWDDDTHHALHVAITGESDGYYRDFAQHPVQQLSRCLTEGFAFQGEFSPYHDAKRGEQTTGLPLSAFVNFIQNHDQIGNRPFGERIMQLASLPAVKAAMAILLLAPSPPLLFMGEEFAASSPFLYFCNFEGDLAKAVTEGRRNEFSRFARFSSPEAREQIPDPNAEETFLKSKLPWGELADSSHGVVLDFYRELLALRKERIVPLLRDCSLPTIERCESEGRRLAIDWRFGNARLQLRGNLGGEQFRPEYSGEILYSSKCDGTECADPGCVHPEKKWFVLWALETRQT